MEIDGSTDRRGLLGWKGKERGKNATDHDEDDDEDERTKTENDETSELVRQHFL
jgi:hypothetical protein